MPTRALVVNYHVVPHPPPRQRSDKLPPLGPLEPIGKQVVNVAYDSGPMEAGRQEHSGDSSRDCLQILGMFQGCLHNPGLYVYGWAEHDLIA